MKRRSRYSSIRQRARRSASWCLALLLLATSALAEVSVVDDRGREVRLDRPAVRVIALYGALNEIVDGLGRRGVLVARTKADDAPGLAALPSVGTHMRPNVEMVVGLAPDLVLQMGGRKAAFEAVDALERHGVRTAFFQAASFAELDGVIGRIGVLLGAEREAAALVADMRARIGRVVGAVRGAPAPRVFFEVRYPNLLAAGQGSVVSEVIRLAGGQNCAQSPKKIARLGEEELLRLDPDVYVVQRGPMNPAPSAPADRPHFAPLSAVRGGRVLFVDEQRFSRPGPRLVEAVEQLAGFLHPDRMQGRE